MALNKRKASKVHWASKHALQITWDNGTVSWFNPATPQALLTEYSFTSRISAEVATGAIAQHAEQFLLNSFKKVKWKR